MSRIEDISRKQARAFSEHDGEKAAEAYAANCVIHDPFAPQPLRGRDAARKDAEDFIRAVPDLTFEITKLISGGEDEGALEVRITGTHKGPLVTPAGEIPATNKRVDLYSAAFVKLDKDGRIVEERRYYDTGRIMQQLGLVPEQTKARA